MLTNPQHCVFLPYYCLFSYIHFGESTFAGLNDTMKFIHIKIVLVSFFFLSFLLDLKNMLLLHFILDAYFISISIFGFFVIFCLHYLESALRPGINKYICVKSCSVLKIFYTSTCKKKLKNRRSTVT